MEVGFTGTQYGMTKKQEESVIRLMKATQGKLHHGVCVGADFQVHKIGRTLGYWIILHPPLKPDQMAKCDGDEVREPKSYLDRDNELVNESEVLIGAPKEEYEINRSGTWYTIRRARKKGIPRYLVYPDGSVERETTRQDGTVEVEDWAGGLVF